MRALTLDQARVVFEDRGSGEPTLLLHGFPESHLAWRHQLPALAETHRVIAPDWLGWGGSDHDATLDYRFEAEVDRLRRFLDAMELDRVNMLAHDYGGLLSLGLATRHPERILRLALLNSRSHSTFPGAFYLGSALIGGLARGPEAIAARVPVEALMRAGMRQGWLHGSRIDFPPEVLEAYLGWLGTESGRRFFWRYFQDYGLPARPELADGFARLTCPTAVIWGDADPWLPIAIAEQLAERNPGAVLTRLAGAGHFVMEERPEEVLGALRQLLARPLEA